MANVTATKSTTAKLNHQTTLYQKLPCNTQKAILYWDVCSRKIYNKKDKHLLCLLIHYKQHYCIFWTHTLYLWNSILMKLLSVVFAFRRITKGWRFGSVHCVISAMTVGTMQNLPDAEKVLHRYCYHFK